MGRKKSRRLTAAQFDAVMCLVLRMSPKRRAAARMALVEGKTGQSIALGFGWQRSAVSNAEATVWEVHQRFLKAKVTERSAIAVPTGWAWMEVLAPTAIRQQIRKDIRIASRSAFCGE